MDVLAKIARKPVRLVAGLLSGTSADGIDCAVCSIEGGGPPADVHTGAPRAAARVKLEAFSTTPYDPGLRARLRRLDNCTAREVAELHAALGDAFAEALLRTVVLHGIPEEALDLAGSHGQTVYHHSGVKPSCTLQLGDADRIAERAGVPVVSDFRARDIAAGGEGAPLTPYADLVLFARPAGAAGRRAVLNLGGIANVTILDDDPRRVVAFDTGPANAPLDRLVRILTNGSQSYDSGGRLAAEGRVRGDLLEAWMRHPFLERRPPKSTGTEVFGDPFVAQAIERHGGVDRDLLATLTAFVARSVVDALRRFAPPGPAIAEVVVAGGGAANETLLSHFRRELEPAAVIPSDALGVPARAREAMAFALLANDAILGLPTSLPSVTGARQAVTLGKLSFAKEGRP